MLEKRIRIALTALGLLALTAAEEIYFNEIPDLPIMPALTR